MINRELKLKLSDSQKKNLESWFPKLTSIYNWGLRTIELNANNRIYFSKFDFCNLLFNHGKMLGISSHTIQGVLGQAYVAWQRCFKGTSRKPKFKSVRNKLNSIPFPDPISINRIKNRMIHLPRLGWIKFYKQSIPAGTVKCGRIIKRSSGWYLQLTINAHHKFPVKETRDVVGIDTGFKDLAILSTGIKFSNRHEFVKGQRRLAQAQRGKRKKLTSRIHERISNRRKDYNHKLSRQIVQNFSEIYITKDNLRGQAKIFGKSVSDAGIYQLRQFISYKGDIHSRKVVLVDSKYTTMTCSDCGAKTGPTGLNGLAVRFWECCVCGAQHDRDVNAAKVVLKIGLGWSLDNAGAHAKRPEIFRLKSSDGN